MHIRDGFLTPDVCLATGVIALGALAWSVRKLRNSLADRTVPLTGMTASLIFAGQMVNFALPPLPVSGHLLGGVLAAALLGPWAGCVAISLVLIIQLALFYDGGWTVLGANIVNMGVIGTWGGYAIYTALRNLLGTGRRGTLIAAFFASWLSVLAAASVFCLEFWLSHRHQGYNFSQVFGWMVFLHCLIGIGEGLITALVLSFVLVQRPDLLEQKSGSATVLSGVGRFVFAGVIAALGVASFLAPFASEHDDGLEAVADRTGFANLGTVTKVLVLDEYAIPALSDYPGLSTAVAGIIGTLVVLAAAWGLSALVKWSRPAASPKV
ncbi:MAG: energy-coupling factor ABC transporter permease [Planctomycetota bacterium]